MHYIYCIMDTMTTVMSNNHLSGSCIVLGVNIETVHTHKFYNTNFETNAQNDPKLLLATFLDISRLSLSEKFQLHPTTTRF